jgi:hypothetical protein
MEGRESAKMDAEGGGMALCGGVNTPSSLSSASPEPAAAASAATAASSSGLRTRGKRNESRSQLLPS